MTSQVGDELLAIKLSAATGAIEWTRKVGSGTPGRMELRVKKDDERREQKFHNLQNMATPSPVTDGSHVVFHFGNGDLAAFDFAGNKLWQHNLQAEHGGYTIWWGHANSPLLVGNLVVSACIQDSLAGLADPLIPSYLVAHDIDTGREVWKTMRMTEAKAESCDAYTTPVLATVGDRQQIVVMGGEQLDGYDPATGKQLWWLPGLSGGRAVTGPTIDADTGMVFATQGMRGPLLAVPLAATASNGGDGKRDSSGIAWKFEQGTPDSSTPVVHGDLLFTVTDDGIARCFNKRTGEVHWKQRVPGDYKASLVAADGKIYFLNTSGVCTVIAAADKFERLAENELPETTIASPAVSGKHIFIRGRKKLYCIGGILGRIEPSPSRRQPLIAGNNFACDASCG